MIPEDAAPIGAACVESLAGEIFGPGKTSWRETIADGVRA